MSILRWEGVGTTYLLIFFGVVAGLVALFLLGSALLSWYARRKVEDQIRRIEKDRSLTDPEADFIIHISNKNRLNVPVRLYTSLRVFDTLVAREIQTLMDSPAPKALKDSTLALAYQARAKLFPQTTQIALAEGESLEMVQEPVGE